MAAEQSDSYGVDEEVQRLQENDPTLKVVDFQCFAADDDYEYDPWDDETREADIVRVAEALKANTQVTELRMHNPPFAVGDDAATALGSALKHNQSIIVVDIQETNFLGASGFGGLLAGLRNNKHVKKLILRSGEMALQAEEEFDTFEGLFPSDVLVLRRVLETCSIEHLDLDTNTISDELAKELAVGLKQNQSVKVLSTTRNTMTAIGASALCEAMEAKDEQGMPAVNLGFRLYERTTEEEHKAMMRLMKRRVIFTVLDLMPPDEEGIGAERNDASLSTAGASIANALVSSKNCMVKKLMMFRISKALQEICSALASGGFIEELELSCCQVSVAEAKGIAQAFRRNTSLQKLCLFDCGIGDAEVEALANTLRRSSMIKSLTIRSYNMNRTESGFVSKRGAMALAAWVRDNKNLQKLCLYGNRIGDEGAAVLAEAISDRDVPLGYLDLSNNCIHESGGFAIARMLQGDDCGLHGCLRLLSNPLSTAAIESIACALKSNHRMKELHLTYIKVPDLKANLALVDMLHYNHGLTTLVFPDIDVDLDQDVQATMNTTIIRALIEALRHNHTLSSIGYDLMFLYKLSYDRIPKEDATEANRLLDLNEKGSVVAAAMKGAHFPKYFVKDLPDAAVPEAMSRMSKRYGLNGLYGFVKEMHTAVSRVEADDDSSKKKRKAINCL